MEVTNIDTPKIKLNNILAFFANKKFSQGLSAKIVGGRGKLINLINNGDIECEIQTQSKNSKWFCNAAQVLDHCRYMKSRNNK